MNDDDKYENQLSRIADILTELHPAGTIKSCGLLECVTWLKDIADELRALRPCDPMRENEADDAADRDVESHVAKMIEHMEFENTLGEQEKSRRRLVKCIAGLPKAVVLAESNKMPWVFLGQLERIVHHANIAFGENWREEVRRERSAWFNSEDDDDVEVESE